MRILHLEDDPFFADMVEELLKAQIMPMRLTRAADWNAFETAVHDRSYDLIVSDHNIPGGDGLKALSLCRRTCPNVPFIFLSGALGEEIAVESLKNGAADYVLKTNISRFIPTVMRTLNAFRETAALRAAEARIRRDQANLHGLIENTTDAIWSMDFDFNIIVFNSAASLLSMKMTGHPMVEGSCLLDKLPPAMQAQWREAARRIRLHDRFAQEHDLEWAGGKGTLEISFHPIGSGKTLTGMAMFGRDVTERKNRERLSAEVEDQRRRLAVAYRRMRVPLHGITRLAGLLGKTPLDESQRHYVSLLESAARRLSDLHARAETPDSGLRFVPEPSADRAAARNSQGMPPVERRAEAPQKREWKPEKAEPKPQD